jgi:hypothetical protein
MINNKPSINVSGYKETQYYTESRPIAGTGIFQNKTDVQIKKKEPAKVKHGVLIGAAIVAGVIFLSYKLDERFS